jgi:hypothetical protein
MTRFIIGLVFLFNSSWFFSQNEVSANWLKPNCNIYYYGLEEESSLNLLEVILSDTNNVIFLTNEEVFLFEQYKNDTYKLGENETTLCDSNDIRLKKILKSNRIYSYSNKSNIYKINPEYLRNCSQSKLDSLLHNLNVTFDELTKGVDSLNNKIAKEVVNYFNFKKIDSLLIFCSYLNQVPNEETVKKITDKNIVFLTHFEYLRRGLQSEEFVLENNSILCTAHKGSKNNKYSPYKIKNRLTKQKEFSIIDLNQIRSKKVRFMTNLVISKSDLKKVKLIYIDELNNCYW